MNFHRPTGWLLWGILAAAWIALTTTPHPVQAKEPVISHRHGDKSPRAKRSAVRHLPVTQPSAVVSENDQTGASSGFDFGYGYRALGQDGQFEGYSYPLVGFHFGYGYRPLGYTFWPRYADYTDFGRYFQNPRQFYQPPYMWRPFDNRLGYNRY